MNQALRAPVVNAIRDLRPLIAAHREKADAQARAQPEVLDALGDAGAYVMLAPTEVGGLEVSPDVFIAALEQIAVADPGAAWQVANSIVAGLAAAALDPEARAAIFEHADRPFGFSMVPGSAKRADGGYEVSGRWPFVTSARHARWIVLSAVIDEPGSAAHGQPRFFYLPACDIAVENTWDQMAAMRGSASDAVNVDAAFVPDILVSGLDLQPLLIDRPLYRISMFPLFVASASAVCLGIWRSAVESMAATTGSKRSSNSGELWADIPTVAGVLGAAEADRRSYLVGALTEAAVVYGIAEQGEVKPADRAALWAILLQCIDQPRMSISRMYAAASTDAWVRGHPMELAMRNIHAINVAIERHRPRLEDAGRVMSGLEATAPIF